MYESLPEKNDCRVINLSEMKSAFFKFVGVMRDTFIS